MSGANPGVLFGDIVFARPLAFALLLVPLIVLWFARRAAARPHVDATGTLEIWQRSALEAPRSATKPRVPLSLWFVVFALACGAIALAGPRSSASASARSLLVVVDRSPSMYLRDGSRTRLEHALELARALSARLGYERVAWIAPPIAADETRAPASMPSTWHGPPRFEVAQPDFAAFDRANTIFVTDRVLESPPKRAGLCCSGGAAVPGLIGVDDGRLVEWDGEKLTPGQTARLRRVEVSGGLPDAVVRVLDAWCSARELLSTRLGSNPIPSDETLLLVHALDGSPEHAVRLGRDGWSADGRSLGPLLLRDADGPLEPWLASAEGEVVVARATGRVYIALSAVEELRGDPAAWAVSWSQLFDDSLGVPTGCVNLRERTAAGEPLTRDPMRLDVDDADSFGPWTAIAAGIAALFALAAACLGLAPARARGVAVR